MTQTRELLAGATARLARAGVGSPRVDAELLLAHCLNLDRGQLALVGEVPSAAAAAFADAVGRREAREPLQHIVGSAPFRHLLLAVGPGVFVPRPETELLLDAVLPALAGIERSIVVDLCAGSGALALAAEDETAGAIVHAIELCEDALVWLRRNCAGTGVRTQAADVRDAGLLPELRGRVDAVLSNPPYVPTGSAVEPEVLADPASAVFAGADGLAVLRAVLDRAAELLRRGGVLAVEHDAGHEQAVPELLAGAGGWQQITAHRDLAGLPRFVTAVRS